LVERLFSRTDEEEEAEEKNEGMRIERCRRIGMQVWYLESTDPEAEEDRHAKPIFLKRLFRVVTTSTK
jgi:serine/threonine protein kinase KIN1/2